MPSLSAFALSTGAVMLLLLVPADAFVLNANGKFYREPPSGKLGPRVIRYDNEPHLDEFLLPVDPTNSESGPSISFKDQFYNTIDALGNFGSSNKEAQRQIIRRRRATNRALALKDTIVTGLGYIVRPDKTWKQFVADPLEEARREDQRKKEEKRRALEEALEKYHAAKNRFYDTLDIISETSRASYRVAKGVGKAVYDTPGNVKKTVKTVQSTAENVVYTVQETSDTATKIVFKVKTLLKGLTSKGEAATLIKPSKTKTVAKAPVATKKKKASSAVKVTVPPPPPPDPKKVKEIWEVAENKVDDVKIVAAAAAQAAVEAPPKQLPLGERIRITESGQVTYPKQNK